jgi:peptide-methionine (R)-S-oxide reductase
MSAALRLLLFLLISSSIAWSPPGSPLRYVADPLTESQDSHSNRRRFLSFATVATLSSVSSTHAAYAMNYMSRSKGYTVQKTDTEWRSILSSTQYDILRNGATERPNSSILEGEERAGIYVCAGCGTRLFASNEKFHSGTGWPSFARSLPGVQVENVGQIQANLAGAELRCGTCGGHLGDVFADGFLFVGTPAFTSGKRYCIDGAALVFQPSNGDPEVPGDQSPPKAEPSLPGWLAPPKITPRET